MLLPLSLHLPKFVHLPQLVQRDLDLPLEFHLELPVYSTSGYPAQATRWRLVPSQYLGITLYYTLE